MSKKKRQLSPEELVRQIVPKLPASALWTLADLGERLEAEGLLEEPTEEEEEALVKAFDELPLSTRLVLADIDREEEKRKES